ncbi:MAG: GDSL-type esterase/lipase family protein [Thermoleophilaceae bacterium]
MRRLSLIVLVVLLGAPASAEAASRRLLVNGDSLAVGTKRYIPRELEGWKVRQSAVVSRHAYQGADVLRSYGRRLPRVIHVSLGTNDDPNQVEAFRAAVDEVMEVAGERRCVVWTNIVRPPYEGTSYNGYNRALAGEDRARENLRVVNWARMVKRNPDWLAEDGVHVSAAGYKARARAVARHVQRCT